MTIYETLTRDVSLAARRLIRTPGFTAIAVLSLSLGIGVNTLMFSFMNAVLLQPLPFPEAGRLVMISMSPANNPGNFGPLGPPMFFLLRDHSHSFDAVGVYDNGRQVNVADDTSGLAAERLNGHRISSTAFQALGVKPLLGRFHTPAEDLSGAEPTIVLSHALWQHRFGGRADIVGQSALIDGQSTAIIGVMPASFELFDGSSDAWLPHAFAPAATTASARWLRGVARLKSTVTIEQAAAEARSLAQEYEKAFPDRGRWALTLQPMDEALFGGMRQPLLLLQAAVGLVLLIACANLAALILTRAVSRQRELAVRAALGQSRGSIVTELMIESLLLSLASGVVGAFVTWVALRPLVALTPAWFPRLDAVGIDVRVFLFCLGVCVIASLVFGLIPALQASRPNLVRALHDSSARASGGRSRMLQLQGLVVVQVMLAFVLLIGAGLVIKTLARLQSVDLGVDTSRLLSLDVQLPRGIYMKENVATAPGITLVDYNPAGRLLIDRFHEALRQMPGAVRVAGSTFAPLTGHAGVEFLLDGAAAAPGKPTFSGYEMVTADYFATLGTKLLRGRDFNEGDQANTPWVAVVNETFARTFWPGQDALGRHLTFKFYNKDGEQPREVVGIVSDTRQFRGETNVQPLVYALHRQQLVRQRASLEALRMRMSFVIRTGGDPLALAASARAAITRVDPAIPVVQVRTVDSYLNGQLQGQRFIATLFAIFAAVALGIGVIGIYGVTAHAVSDRYREFGIRRALGAGTGNVLGLVIRRSLVILLIGVALGIGAALALTRFVENFLWGVTRSDPATFVTIAAILIGAGIVACLVPGTRATRIDPLVALRHD